MPSSNLPGTCVIRVSSTLAGLRTGRATILPLVKAEDAARVARPGSSLFVAPGGVCHAGLVTEASGALSLNLFTLA